MASIDELSRALIAADKAGDAQAARILAAEITKMRAAPKADNKEFAFDPMRDMTAGDRFLAGAGKGMTDIVRGIGQTVGMVNRADVAETRKRDAALMSTTGGTVGNVAGTVAALLPTAFIPGAATLPGAAAIGAGTGLLAPSTSTEETLRNTAFASMAGPAGVLLGRGVGAAYQGGKALVEPFFAGGRERIAGRVLGEFASDPSAVQAARGVPSATGARPTLAEASRDPGIATLERSLAQQDPKIAAAIGQRAMDNNAARVGIVENLAGTDAQRAAAEAARKAASENAYQQATKANYKVDGELSDLLQRPAVKQAMERARTMAANQGRPFSFDVSPQDMFKGVGNTKVDASKQVTGQGLQDLKMALDDMLSDPASGFAGKSGDVVKQLRSQVVAWMEKANPEFKAAREGYAAASKPLNQMDVGQRLVEKTTSAIKDLGGNNRLQANAFARALNDEQTLVRKATGFRGVNGLDDVLTPQQTAALNAVRDELELVANLSTAANGPGSQTAKSLASGNMLRRLLGPTGMPQSWAESALLQTAVRPVQFAMQAAEPKIQNRLAEIMLNPEQAAAAMAAARALPLSSRAGSIAAPYMPQLGLNPLAAANSSRTQ
jgi:hypothetical protein